MGADGGVASLTAEFAARGVAVSRSAAFNVTLGWGRSFRVLSGEASVFSGGKKIVEMKSSETALGGS